jgi:hypothetical protein
MCINAIVYLGEENIYKMSHIFNIIYANNLTQSMRSIKNLADFSNFFIPGLTIIFHFWTFINVQFVKTC